MSSFQSLDEQYPSVPWLSNLAVPFRYFDALEQQERERCLEVARVREERIATESQKDGLQPSGKNVPSAPSSESATLHIARPQLAGRGRCVRLIEEAVLRAAHARATKFGSADKVGRKNAIEILQRVAGRGLERRLNIPTRFEQGLNALRDAHPQFIDVIDFIGRELCMARASRQPAAIPPILLNGPPGCGKTYFAQFLAEFFATPLIRISMEAAQCASELSGSAEYWGNSKPGRLFDTLVDGDFANPVVMLDEVDKSGGHEGHRADRSLYGLLERESAKVWSDLAFPTLHMDASHVVWILTSNNLRKIAEPLRTRMEIFTIQPLDAPSARRLVRQIFRRVVQSLPALKFDAELDVSLADMLRAYSPRQVTRLSRALIGEAIEHGRRSVTAADLNAVGANRAALEVWDRCVDSACWGSQQ